MKNRRIQFLLIGFLLVCSVLLLTSCQRQNPKTMFETENKNSSELLQWINENKKIDGKFTQSPINNDKKTRIEIPFSYDITEQTNPKLNLTYFLPKRETATNTIITISKFEISEKGTDSYTVVKNFIENNSFSVEETIGNVVFNTDNVVLTLVESSTEANDVEIALENLNISANTDDIKKEYVFVMELESDKSASLSVEFGKNEATWSTSIYKTKAKEFIRGFVYEEELDKLKNKYQYQKEIIKNNLVDKYSSYIDNSSSINLINLSNESKWVEAANFKQSCTSASNRAKTDLINQVEKANGQGFSVYELVCAYVFRTDDILQKGENAPIKFYASSFGDFMGHLFNNLLVFPIAWLIVQISNIFGGFYVIGLLIVTLLVRTIAWPIYAKTNDMSLKMSLMQPEINEIQAKYANRQDDRSKQMMQMEMSQVYKKYKMGLGGCLMPFLQLPIFMAVYRAVNRIPYTVKYAGTIFQNDWANELNPNFLGINLLEDRTVGTGQLIGVIILMIIVVGTQFLGQWLSQRRQKKTQDASQEDIPAYRRKSYEQTKGGNANSMKFMMYGMMLMMGLFVFTSKAGLGLYWCIGNLYSMLQTEINSRTSKKRLEKIKKSL